MAYVKVGDRIRLTYMANDPNPIEPGNMGTVTYVGELRGLGVFQLGVNWDNGRTLMLAVPEDKFEIVKEDQP